MKYSLWSRASILGPRVATSTQIMATCCRTSAARGIPEIQSCKGGNLSLKGSDWNKLNSSVFFGLYPDFIHPPNVNHPIWSIEHVKGLHPGCWFFFNIQDLKLQVVELLQGETGDGVSTGFTTSGFMREFWHRRRGVLRVFLNIFKAPKMEKWWVFTLKPKM